LPLISDSEMLRLFGAEVASALAEMERFNLEGSICQSCRGGCCRLVSCELYTPGLTLCPVQNFRPLLCRMHFCRHFSAVYPLLVKESGDIYLDSLIAAEKSGYKGVFLFDCPPLSRPAPGLVEALSQSLLEIREGRLDGAVGLKAVEAAFEGYQSKKAVPDNL
jgi:hypothetical protein